MTHVGLSSSSSFRKLARQITPVQGNAKLTNCLQFDTLVDINPSHLHILYS